MKYYHFHFSNGFCGCDEDEYEQFNHNVNESYVADYFIDALINTYSFFEPDRRFCDIDNKDEVELYQEYCKDQSYYKEMSKEEYERSAG